MPEGLKIIKHGGPFITAQPSVEQSASEAVLGLLTGPLKIFSDRVDSVLAAQGKRIEQLEKEVAALKAVEPKRGKRR